MKRIIAACGWLVGLFAIVSIVWGVTASYNSTVRIVNSAGNVLGGVASATTALYNQTVRVVDSTGHVLDSFLSPSNLNTANVNQAINTQAGNPLTSISGFTYGVENTMWQFSLPANTLGLFDVMKCHVYGDEQNNTGGTIQDTWRFYVGSQQVTTGAQNISTNAAIKPWSVDVTFANDGAANLNSMDSLFYYIAGGGNNGAVGNLSTAGSAWSAAGLDMTQAQTVKLTLVVGAATPAATPTASPTAAGTPIAKFFHGECFKLPGMTPTPTPTPTQTPTPQPT